MKKSLLFMFLVAMTCDLFANMQQTGWRWRNDDGDLVAATWRGADTIATTITDTTSIIRLRIRIDNTGDGSKTTSGLGYSTSQITTTGTNAFDGNNAAIIAIPAGDGGFFRWAPSTYVANGTAADSIPIRFASHNAGDKKTDYQMGIFLSQIQNFVVAKNFSSEIEYSIKPTKNLVPGDYFFFPKGGQISSYPNGSNFEKMAKLTFNGAPYFVKGLNSAITVTTTSSMIDSLCTVGDLNLGQTLTWSLLEDAKNGVVTGFPVTANSTKGLVTPANLLYTPTADYSGADSLKVVCSDGFSVDTIALKINVDIPTSLKSLFSSLSNVTLSPNPTADYIKLSNLPLDATSVKVTIINAFGKVTKTVTAYSAAGKALVAVSELQKGLYIVKIQDGVNTLIQKMVKK